MKSKSSGDTENFTSPDGKLLSYLSHADDKPSTYSVYNLELSELSIL